MHLITTEIIIAQMAFSHCSTDGPGNDVERVKYLYSCTESIKAWFEVGTNVSRRIGVTDACSGLLHNICQSALWSPLLCYLADSTLPAVAVPSIDSQ
jgi:hypothetical protein